MDRFKRQGVTYSTGDSLACNVMKSRVDEFASRAVRDLRFDPGSDIYDIISKFGGRIHYESAYAFLDEDATIIVHAPLDFDIALTMLGKTRRDRFTLAHELGHYLLHSRQGHQPMIASRKGSTRVEWEANWFAAGFLMPRDDFEEDVKSGLDDRQLSRKYGVSNSAIEVRKKSLGLLA